MSASRPPLWFIFAVTTSGILANSMLTTAIPDVLADFGLPDDRAGVLVASGPLPGILMAPVIGVLADRFGRRNVLVPCLVLFGFAGLASAFAPTFNLLLLGRVIQGIGGAGLINLGVVLIGDHWSGNERTKIIGWNSAVLTLCLAILPLVSGIITDLASWRWAIATASLSLPVAVMGFAMLPEGRPEIRRTIRQQIQGAAEVVKTPIVRSVIITGVLLFMVIFGVFLTALPIHLENEFGLSASQRGPILAAPAIGSTIAAFNLGRIRASVKLKPVLIAASGLITLSALGIGLAPSIFLIVFASVIYGLGDGAAISALQDTAVSATPDSQRAAVMAAWVSSVRTGQTLGPLLFAALLGRTSTETAILAGAALFAAVTAFLGTGPITEAGVKQAQASA